jgi:hypothetical protein
VIKAVSKGLSKRCHQWASDVAGRAGTAVADVDQVAGTARADGVATGGSTVAQAPSRVLAAKASMQAGLPLATFLNRLFRITVTPSLLFGTGR